MVILPGNEIPVVPKLKQDSKKLNILGRDFSVWWCSVPT